MIPKNYREASNLLSGRPYTQLAPGITLIQGSPVSGAIHIVRDRTSFVSFYEDDSFSMDVGELTEPEVQKTVGRFLSHLAGVPVELVRGDDKVYRYSRRETEYPVVAGQRIYL